MPLDGGIISPLMAYVCLSRVHVAGAAVVVIMARL
jgi:hypothetical protein